VQTGKNLFWHKYWSQAKAGLQEQASDAAATHMQ